jgi:hypothetical protein
LRVLRWMQGGAVRLACLLLLVVPACSEAPTELWDTGIEPCNMKLCISPSVCVRLPAGSEPEFDCLRGCVETEDCSGQLECIPFDFEGADDQFTGACFDPLKV